MPWPDWQRALVKDAGPNGQGVSRILFFTAFVEQIWNDLNMLHFEPEIQFVVLMAHPIRIQRTWSKR